MKLLTTYNRTKIVATIGPASSSKEVISELIRCGMSVARLNFSHDSHESHQRIIDNIREINEATGSNVGILADLQGPKIRIGKVKGQVLTLTTNENIVLNFGTKLSDNQNLYVSYENIGQDVSVGEKVLIDDGKIVLQVTQVISPLSLSAQIVHGGVLTANKGVNLPNTKTKLSCLTPKDLKDLDFIIKNDLDWVALSFVRCKEDVLALKKCLSVRNADIKIMSKIEKPEAVENINEIIEHSDSIMVARGDLGVEMAMEKVPVIQKQIVQKCVRAAKPVVIATQMLQSMLESPSPSRAEINDVANSVIDGADAVMLSNETAVGLYPVKAVEAMYKTIKSIEEDFYDYNTQVSDGGSLTSIDFNADSVCDSACHIAKKTKAAAIVGMTWSGYTALKISSHRPRSRVYIFTANERLLKRLSLVWGIRTFKYANLKADTDTTVEEVDTFLKTLGAIQAGDIVINTFAAPLNAKIRTNSIRLTVIK